MKTTATLPTSGSTGDIERLRGRRADTLDGEKARLRKATTEFESFFTYQLMKTMRQTIPTNTLTEDAPMQDGMGKELFTDLFDMEVSRSMASSSQRSIGDLMYRSLEKIIEAQYQTPTELPLQKAISRVSTKPISLKPEALPVTPKVEVQPHTLPQQAVPLFRSITPETKQPVAPPSGEPKPVTNSETNTKATSRKPSTAMERIVSTFGDHIEEAARRNQVDSSLIASVIRVESGGNPSALSSKGAKGLMQLVDSTAQDYGVADSFDPAENIHAGSKFLKRLLDRYQDVTLALAAYNAGPGNVDKYGGVPPFKETQDFVAKVTGYLSEAAGVLTGQDLKNSKN